MLAITSATIWAAAQLCLLPVFVQDPAEPEPREWLDGPVPWVQWTRLTGTWGDLRTELEALGISVDLSYLHDASLVLHGGEGHPTANRGLLLAGTTLDLEPLVGWEGGRVRAEYDTLNGENGSERDVGDLQVYSNIDGAPFGELLEIWFEQRLFDEAIRFKIGKVDANSEFGYVENGAEFLNSSMSISPTVLALPTLPDPAASVNLFVAPDEHWYAGLGCYDGATQAGTPTGPRGLGAFIDGPDELFTIGELGVRWSLGASELPGRLAAGGWHHSADFERFDGSVDHGTSGVYALLDQIVWRENPEAADDLQGMGVFFQYGHADADVSAIVDHVGSGVAWTGAIPSRDLDVTGLGVTWAHVTGEPGAELGAGYELANELFYKLQLTPFLSLKPDLQCIVNPGGSGTAADAWVGTLRLEAVF